MTYRDRAIQCPRCGNELTRNDDRDRWRCARCNGALFAVAEVIAELVESAPDLVPGGGIGDLHTLGRRAKTPVMSCALCGGDMEPVFLGGVEIDRCYHDQMIWFDRGELNTVRDVATQQRDERQRPWLVKLLGF